MPRTKEITKDVIEAAKAQMSRLETVLQDMAVVSGHLYDQAS